MSEAIWIELIKVLPAFLWVAFGFIALAIAKRIFTAQAPRMTKVETPWVTVELAQQAIEQAGLRGATAPPAVEPAWPSNLYPLPTQQVPPGNRNEIVHGHPIGAVPLPPQFQPPADEDTEDAVHTEPPVEAEPDHATPPADAPADGTEPPDPDPRGAVTAPNQQIPNIPPTYPVLAPPNGNGYPAPGQNLPFWGQNAPYQHLPAYQPAQADKRSLRAATKLALAAGELQGGAILWVDDHPEWNEPMVRLFRTAGIIVDLAMHTDDALRALEKRPYDLVITDLRRDAETDGDTAGIRLLDRIVAAGVPTPAVIYSDNPNAQTTPHPRAITTTNVPEQLVDIVVEFVGDRRDQQSAGNASSWIDRLTGK
jgi:CheY-like chemotaxis protein